MKYIRVIVFITLLVGLVFAPVYSHAFSVSPLKNTISIAPGSEEQVVSITINNSDDQSAKYTLRVLGAKQLDDGKLSWGNNYSMVEKWVTPDKDIVTVGAHQSENGFFKINIPNSATAGSYYLGLVAEMVGSTGGAVGVSGQIISILSLQIAGTVRESAELFDVNVIGGMFQSVHPYVFSVRNTGVAMVPLNVVATANDPMGREVAVVNNVSGAILLPGAARKFGSDLRFSRFGVPGPYEVQVKIKYGLTGQTSTVIRSIWYFPPFTSLFIIIIIIGFGVWRFRQMRTKAKV